MKIRGSHFRSHPSTKRPKSEVQSLAVELLEARTMPALITWINPAGGDWSAPSNWDGGVIPGPTDDVLIDIAENILITHSTSSSDSVRSIACSNALHLSNGSITIGNASTFDGPLTISGGSFNGAGDLTINETFTWTNGNLFGSGRVTANGGMLIQAGHSIDLGGRVLENAGNATWGYSEDGILTMSDGAVIRNLPGATFDLQADVRLVGTGAFENEGIMTKTAGTGETEFNVPFHNEGSVEIDFGSFSARVGGNSTGSFQIDAGARLTLVGGSTADYILAPGSSVAGPGIFFVKNTNVRWTIVEGALDAPVLMESGTLEVTANIAPSALDIGGGTLTGTGTVTVLGPLTWTSGKMTGAGRTVASGGLLLNNTLTTNAPSLDGRILENAATAIWIGTHSIGASNGGSLVNLPGAVFEARTDLPLLGSGSFVNQGILRKSGGSAETTFKVALHNEGLVEVTTGSFILEGGGTSDGTFTVGSGTGLQFLAGNYSLTTTSELNGDGFISFAGATVSVLGSFDVHTTNILGGLVTVNHDATVTVMSVSNGTLAGTGTLEVDQLNWTGGTMSDTGSMNVLNNLVLNGSALKSLVNGRALESASAGVWSGAGNFLIGTGAKFTNRAGALFLIQSNATMNASGTPPGIENEGIFRKTASTGTSQIHAPLHNSGSVEIATGTMSLVGGGSSSGTFEISSQATLAFSGGTYVLTGSAQVTGEGSIRFDNAFGSPPNVTISGSIDVGITMLAGTVIVEPDTSIPGLDLAGGVLGGPGLMTIVGTFSWTGGTLMGPGRTVAQGGLTLVSSLNSTPVLNNRVLDNAAVATWMGTGNIAFSNNPTFNNLAGSLFDIQCDGILGSGSSTGSFNNAGIIQKSASDGETRIGTALSNLGEVAILIGELVLGKAGTSTGSFAVAEHATLRFDSAYSMSDSSAIVGAGTADFSGGTVTISGAFDLPFTVISGGTASFVNDVELPTLTLLSGSLAGTGQVTITGPLVWQGGNMSGTGRTVASGGITIATPGTTNKAVLGRILVNESVATWTGLGTFDGSSSGVFVNLPGSVFEIRGDGKMDSFQFYNAGFVRKKLSYGITSIEVHFNNVGETQIESGTLQLRGTITSSGTFDIGPGAILSTAAGTLQLSASSTVTGNGLALFDSGTAIIAGAYMVDTLLAGATIDFTDDVNIPRLTMTGGDLIGNGTVTVTGFLEWLGGEMGGSGRTVALGGLAITGNSGTANVRLNARTLDNAATAIWVGYHIEFSNGAVLNNLAGAIFEVRTNAEWYSELSSGVINNYGTFRKSFSGGTSTLHQTFNNYGIIDADTGTLFLGGGLSNFVATSKTLVGGSYRVKATLKFPQADIVVNAAALLLDGPQARVIDSELLGNALQNLARNAMSGEVTLANNHTLTTFASFVNSGKVSIGEDCIFQAATSYTQKGGATTLTGGTLGASDLVVLRRGILSGWGTIKARVVNSAVLRVGGNQAAGILTINGDYSQTSNGTLVAKIGGPNPGSDYDRLEVAGQASFDGTLQVDLVNNFLPDSGDEFTVIVYATGAGTFATLAGDGPQFVPNYGTNGLTLVKT